jgi:hypothetical protein
MAESFALKSVRALETKSSDKAIPFIFSRPLLLDHDVHDLLERELAELSAEDRGSLANIVATLRSMRERIDAGEAPYPLGLGPVEALWQRMKSGEIRADYAERLVQDADLLAALTPEFVERLSHSTRKMLSSKRLADLPRNPHAPPRRYAEA